MNIYESQDLQKVQAILCKETVNDEDKDIVISEKARSIKGEAEFAFLGEEFTSTEEIKPVICDGGATSTLSSSFENCTDCQSKTAEIKTAEGGVVMTTTNVCVTTTHVRTRADEPLKQVNIYYFLSSAVSIEDIHMQLKSWIVTQDIDG
jgi:hypothetical protein